MMPDDCLPNCTFCGFVKAGDSVATPEFMSSYPKLASIGQVVERTVNFYVIPDIAPLAIDHLLVVTRSHFPSLAVIPDSHRGELKSLLFAVLRTMRVTHPRAEVLAFEHGVGTIDGQTIQCGTCGRTDHAHLHIVPLPPRAEPAARFLINYLIDQFGLKMSRLSPLPLFEVQAVAGTLPYMYIWSGSDTMAYALVQESVEQEIPSQLIRRLVSTEWLGNSDDGKWDWRNFVVFHAHEGGSLIEHTMAVWREKLPFAVRRASRVEA